MADYTTARPINYPYTKTIEGYRGGPMLSYFETKYLYLANDRYNKSSRSRGEVMIHSYRSDALYRAEVPTRSPKTLRTLPIHKKRMGHFPKRVTEAKYTIVTREKETQQPTGNILKLFEL
jgi:hypothetical protein